MDTEIVVSGTTVWQRREVGGQLGRTRQRRSQQKAVILTIFAARCSVERTTSRHGPPS